ncbi:UNKNOWN [Stylonychia lemnae]|uniref:Uncharacterized protein n=1 Tax=Stylonychia lemnae TaxID=5949 RepID=A0A078AJV8_STYLE|nr:UNKNOWN [Stylonychia lemnae]|eukprot:CDW81747.1 UNKNOWN [Stylonychia lemnae]
MILYAVRIIIRDVLVPIFNYGQVDNDQKDDEWEFVIKIVNYEVLFYGATDLITSLNILLMFKTYGVKKERRQKKNKNETKNNNMINDITEIIEADVSLSDDSNYLNGTKHFKAGQQKDKIQQKNDMTGHSLNFNNDDSTNHQSSSSSSDEGSLMYYEKETEQSFTKRRMIANNKDLFTSFLFKIEKNSNLNHN